MKFPADKTLKEGSFKIGNQVFLKLRPHRQASLAQRRNEKLSPKYFGPYPVLACIGKMSYLLQLPASCSLCPVFHVSLLKAAVPAQYKPIPLPKLLTEDKVWLTEPDSILAIRKAPRGNVLEVLVQWTHLPEFEATWESSEVIDAQFPDFNLEDKVTHLGGSIDKLAVTMAMMTKKKRTSGRVAREFGNKQSVRVRIRKKNGLCFINNSAS